MFVAQFADRKTLSATMKNRDNLSATMGLGGVSMVGGSSIKLSEITLLASKWEGAERSYSQVVTIDGITPYSKVDLQPSVEQLEIFHDKDIAFSTENEDGIITVFVIGDKPTNDYTIQATITEVKA